VITRSRKTLGILAATATLSALAITTGTAAADPPAGEPLRPIVGVGSDTTDPVMNGLAEAIRIDGQQGPWPVLRRHRPHVQQPRHRGQLRVPRHRPGNTSDPNLRRPERSTAGRNALIAARTRATPGFGCLDFAPLVVAEPERPPPVQLTYIPFAQTA
jgi:hypothetical protein